MYLGKGMWSSCGDSITCEKREIGVVAMTFLNLLWKGNKDELAPSTKDGLLMKSLIWGINYYLFCIMIMEDRFGTQDDIWRDFKKIERWELSNF